MDPLSITTGCLTLLSATGKTITSITSFIRGCREARKDLITVSGELSELRVVIELLHEEGTVNDEDILPESLREQVVAIINNCLDVVKRIDIILADLGRKSGPVRWVVSGKTEVAGLRTSLCAHRDSLNLILELVTINISRSIKDDTSTIRQGVSDIKSDTVHISRLLEEVNHLRDLLESRQLAGTQDNIILERYLDNVTSYAESVMGDAPSIPGDAGNEQHDAEVFHTDDECSTCSGRCKCSSDEREAMEEAISEDTASDFDSARELDPAPKHDLPDGHTRRSTVLDHLNGKKLSSSNKSKESQNPPPQTASNREAVLVERVAPTTHDQHNDVSRTTETPATASAYSGKSSGSRIGVAPPSASKNQSLKDNLDAVLYPRQKKSHRRRTVKADSPIHTLRGYAFGTRGSSEKSWSSPAIGEPAPKAEMGDSSRSRFQNVRYADFSNVVYFDGMQPQPAQFDVTKMVGPFIFRGLVHRDRSSKISITFTKDSSLLAVGNNRVAFVVETESMTSKREITSPTGSGILGVAFPDKHAGEAPSDTLAVVCAKEIHEFSIADGSCIGISQLSRKVSGPVSIDPSCRYVACPSAQDRSMILVVSSDADSRDSEDLPNIATIANTTSLSAYAFGFRKDGKELVILWKRGHLQVVSAPFRTAPKASDIRKGRTWPASLIGIRIGDSASGLVATAWIDDWNPGTACDVRLQLGSLRNGRFDVIMETDMEVVPLGSSSPKATFSPGCKFVALYEARRLIIRSITDSSLVYSRMFQFDIRVVKYSPDGRVLIVVGDEKLYKISGLGPSAEEREWEPPVDGTDRTRNV